MPKQTMSLYQKPTRKLLGFVFLAAIALTAALSTFAYAADITVNDEATLRAAVAGAPATPYEIELTDDIALTGSPLIIPTGKDITLTGAHSLTGADGQDTIAVSGALTLDGITVTHAVGGTGIGDLGRGVTVQSGGTLTLSSGEVSGNTVSISSYDDGAGVYNSGTFTLSGGKVSGNTAYGYGGGVCNSSIGTFTITGGEVSGNWAFYGGGVDNSGTLTLSSGSISTNIGRYNAGGVLNNGTFAMEGGTISGNTTEIAGGVLNGGTFAMSGGVISGNSVLIDAGGVLNANSFTLSGGEISDNTAQKGGGGVLNHGTFAMEGGKVSGNRTRCISLSVEIGSVTMEGGGGVHNTGTFTLKDGDISGNTAAFGGTWPPLFVVIEGGGGIFNSGTFAMEGGKVSGNEAPYGGGVYGNSGTFTLSGGEISGNTAVNSGGGVCNDDATFTMKGGEVSGNDAAIGGGVYNGDTFTMEDGEISGNTALSFGGGVTNAGTFTIDGGEISDNEAPYGGGVYNYGTVTIADGEISGNEATLDGGGIFTTDYARLTVAAGAVFSNNKAQAAYGRIPADDAVYAAQIHGTAWTTPFTQGYNNYDINYTKGSPVVVAVAFDGNGGTVVAADATRTLSPGASLGAAMPPAPTRSGHTFTGWNTAANGSGTAFTSATVVNADITVFAQWAARDKSAIPTAGDDTFRLYGLAALSLLLASTALIAAYRAARRKATTRSTILR